MLLSCTAKGFLGNWGAVYCCNNAWKCTFMHLFIHSFIYLFTHSFTCSESVCHLTKHIRNEPRIQIWCATLPLSTQAPLPTSAFLSSTQGSDYSSNLSTQALVIVVVTTGSRNEPVCACFTKDQRMVCLPPFFCLCKRMWTQTAVKIKRSYSSGGEHHKIGTLQ